MTTLKILSVGAAHKFIESIDLSQIECDDLRIEAEYDTVGATATKLRAKQAADIVIVSAAVARDLVQEGRLVADSITPIGKVKVCVASRASDRDIDLATVADFQTCLLQAPVIFIPDPLSSTAGKHFAKVIESLPFGATVREKMVAHPNGATAMRALAASPIVGAIGCTQSTEIISTPGLKVSGEIPAPWDLTTVYVAAVSSAAPNPHAAGMLIGFFRDPASNRARLAAGFV